MNGMELQNKKINRFSNLVAREFGVHDWNVAKIGAGNDFLQRTVYNSVLRNERWYSIVPEHVETRNHKYPSEKNGVPTVGKYEQHITRDKAFDRTGRFNLVVCMWSGINRVETLRQSNITQDWGWTINTWSKFFLDPKTLKAAHESKAYIDRQLEVGEEKIIAGYMKRVRNAHFNLRLSIGHMLSVKYFLQSQGINQLHYLFSHGQYRPLLPILDWETWENTNNWWASQDLNREQIVAELPFLESEGFYDMCTRSKHAIGVKDHPLEEGHKAMAERIIKDIKTNEFDKEFN
jgi:hypothetical protein